jgi:hypothetical protein
MFLCSFAEYILPGWEYAQLGYQQALPHYTINKPKKPVEEKERADKTEMLAEFDMNDLLERLENDVETKKHKERQVARKSVAEQHRRLQLMAQVLREYQMDEETEEVENIGWAKARQSSKEGKFRSFDSDSGSRRSSASGQPDVGVSPAAEKKMWKTIVKQSSEEGRFSNTPPGSPAMKRVEEVDDDLEKERKHESYPGNPGNPGEPENAGNPTGKKNWKKMVQQVSDEMSTPPASPAVQRLEEDESDNPGTPTKTWKKMVQQASDEKKFYTPPATPTLKRLEEVQGTPKKPWTGIMQQSSADGRMTSLTGTPVDSPLAERKPLQDDMPTWNDVKKDLNEDETPLEDKMPSWDEVKKHLKPGDPSLEDKMPSWYEVKQDLNQSDSPLEDKMPSWDEVKKDLNPAAAAELEEKEKKSWKKMAKQTSLASIASSRNSPACSPKTSVQLHEPLNEDSLPALAEDPSSGSSPVDGQGKTFKKLAKRASAASLKLSKEVSPKRTPPDGASPDGQLDTLQDMPEVKKSWKKMAKQASVVSSIVSTMGSPDDSRRESTSSDVAVEKKSWTRLIKESSEDGRMTSLSGSPSAEKKSMLGSPDGEEVETNVEEKRDADGESVPENGSDPVVSKQPGSDQEGGKGKWMMVRQASQDGEFKAVASPAVGIAAE